MIKEIISNNKNTLIKRPLLKYKKVINYGSPKINNLAPKTITRKKQP